MKQGLGIARIPSFVVGQDVAKKRLVRVLPEWELPRSGRLAIGRSMAVQALRTTVYSHGSTPADLCTSGLRARVMNATRWL